jgi:cobalt-precorrin-5B (C1)-methyltransferase
MPVKSKLKTGLSTGTCAAAAAKAAVLLLSGSVDKDKVQAVEITLPTGKKIKVPIKGWSKQDSLACAWVEKDAGDDPDLTHGLEVHVQARFNSEGNKIEFVRGKGLGVVTRPGLPVPVGEPAINPVPRQMIIQAIREVTALGVQIKISIPGGEEVAHKTFNPRLGIKGGISILGTTGVVRPYSVAAIKETIGLNINMVWEMGYRELVLVPGNIGNRAATSLGFNADIVVEVSNEWAYALDKLKNYDFRKVTILGHAGKLLKFINGHFQTHSQNSPSAVPIFLAAVKQVLGIKLTDVTTVEGGFSCLGAKERQVIGNHLAKQVFEKVQQRLSTVPLLQVVLINLKGEILGKNL